MKILTTMALCAGLLASSAAAQKKLKVYVSVDMEGIAGAVTPDQLWPKGFEYPRFREIMTAEALAAVEGARAAGAAEFVVADSHGNGESLLIDKFPKEVQIVRSWPRPLGMMQGIDNTFDAAIFIGYHTGGTNPDGVRGHSMSSAYFTDLRLNGSSVAESGLNAAIAGHFDVPVVMISGDDATVKEAQAVLPDVEGAVVKWSYGFHSARTLTPDAALEIIREKARRGVTRAKEIKPYKVKAPVELEIRFKNVRPVELLSYLPIVERADVRAVRFRGRDLVEVSKFLEFVRSYEVSLSP